MKSDSRLKCVTFDDSKREIIKLILCWAINYKLFSSHATLHPCFCNKQLSLNQHCMTLRPYLFQHQNYLLVLSMLDWSHPHLMWPQGLWFDLVGRRQSRREDLEHLKPQMHLQMLFWWNSPSLSECSHQFQVLVDSLQWSLH